MIARLLEELVQIALAVSDPHIQHVIDANRNEAGPDFTRDRARKIGFTATRRTVHENAAANRLAVGFVKLGMSQRMNDLQLDFFFDFLHPADVLESHFGALDFPFCGCWPVLPGSANFSFDDFALLLMSADSQTACQFEIGHRAIQFNRAAVLGYCLLYLTNPSQQLCMQ